jgi:transposase-like protein
MKRVPTQKHTVEFKVEAVRLVNSGVRLAEAARQLAVNENTLWNWCKADRDGKLVAGNAPKVTPEQMELSIPRDRNGRFDPVLIAKYRRRFPGFDDKIIALYARGMSPRDIQGHVRELYGIEVSPDLVSAVTDSVIDEVSAWQSRPLESTDAIVFFDALRVKIRDEGLVRNKAVYLAIGVRPSGHKEVLGLWIEQSPSVQQSIQ